MKEGHSDCVLRRVRDRSKVVRKRLVYLIRIAHWSLTRRGSGSCMQRRIVDLPGVISASRLGRMYNGSTLTSTSRNACSNAPAVAVRVDSVLLDMPRFKEGCGRNEPRWHRIR